MIYGKVGRRWVQFNNGANPDHTVDDMVYGAARSVADQAAGCSA